MEDIDNVLRVEVLKGMTEEDLIGLTIACGFEANVLPETPYVSL